MTFVSRLAPWAGKLKVGIAWSGFQGQVNNRNRAVPLSTLMPLLQMQRVQCFSLQKGDAGPWTDVAPGPKQLVDLAAEWRDFNDSAAMLQHLDVVITVDTAVSQRLRPGAQLTARQGQGSAGFPPSRE